MKVKETRWMDMDDLRGLCIKHGWVTRIAEFSFTVVTCLEVQYGDIEVVTVKTCHSLAAAQKWLEQHWRNYVPDERCESYTREGAL